VHRHRPHHAQSPVPGAVASRRPRAARLGHILHAFRGHPATHHSRLVSAHAASPRVPVAHPRRLSCGLTSTAARAHAGGATDGDEETDNPPLGPPAIFPYGPMPPPRLGGPTGLERPGALATSAPASTPVLGLARCAPPAARVAPPALTRATQNDETCPLSTGGSTRRVRLVRGEGRDVSS
jgi:hypothetical protein